MDRTTVILEYHPEEKDCPYRVKLPHGEVRAPSEERALALADFWKQA